MIEQRIVTKYIVRPVIGVAKESKSTDSRIVTMNSGVAPLW